MVHCRKPDENTKPFEKLFIGGPVTITPASEVLTVELLAFFTKDFANPDYIAVRVYFMELFNYKENPYGNTFVCGVGGLGTRLIIIKLYCILNIFGPKILTFMLGLYSMLFRKIYTCKKLNCLTLCMCFSEISHLTISQQSKQEKNIDKNSKLSFPGH